MKLTPAQKASFRKTVKEFYLSHKRLLPWRENVSPYTVFISEVMLQQTQVQRVRTKFGPFVERFPDFATLAAATLEEVLQLWKGLGYNRRAQSLRNAAQIIVNEYDGTLPSSPEELKKLPGIGVATAASIAAFAFNAPTLFLETNIRTVYIHHFFPNRSDVSDHELLELAEQTIDRTNASDWYSALMDYGTELKKQEGNLTRNSAYYKKQSSFSGSRRQLRGLVLSLLLENKTMNLNLIVQNLERDAEQISEVLEHLTKEGIVAKKRSSYVLAE
ncbi:hypothetical protein QA601_15035 [Chitinispirillales bacterium ANBcel5]|uniref:A/G-specific adenine glycosylase n=1 Tax=Cellulosispirillum alkaliphilum TaxID=3039283 RepID=UPI002A567879|nr:hypothetical protein [Chitinispirillales bacterium ANBcel5]